MDHTNAFYFINVRTFNCICSRLSSSSIHLYTVLIGQEPVFYYSDRVGKNGKLFKNYKLRTMVSDSDERFGSLQARENDKTVTKIGRVLRFQ